MQGPDNPAPLSWDDPWRLAGSRFDQSAQEWETTWRRANEEEPSRWLRSRAGLAGSGIRVDGYGADVYLNLPAVVRSFETIEERTKTGNPWRSSVYEMSATLVRDVDESGSPRVVTEAVTIQRKGRAGVTTAALRCNLGELIDWALTREPVSERVGVSSYLGAGHPAAFEALRAGKRKTGKRGREVISVEAVAEVARRAPARGLVRELQAAFPNVGRSTLMRALADARAVDPSLHTARSRQDSIARPSRGPA